MTTDAKLLFLNTEAGLQWGEIAEELGVSRQMICGVRRGLKRFSSQTELRLDHMVEKYSSTSVNHEAQQHQFKPTETDANSALIARLAAGLEARLSAVEERLAAVERLLLRLAADADGGRPGSSGK